MELTLGQALKKGIEAHKAGQVTEADQYYTAILKVQPKHPDANHNMGVLAVGVGKIQEALPFFKTALEANPSIAQFWLSYIDALIKLNRMDDAKAVFNQAKSKGVKGNGLEQLKKRLGPYSESKNDSKDPEKSGLNILEKLNLHQALKLAKKNFRAGLSEKAKEIYQDILKKFPKNKKALDGIKEISKSSHFNDPTQEQLQSLINLYTQGQFQKALTKGLELLKYFPNSVYIYNIIGAANKDLGKLDEAIEAYNKAISIRPDFAESYNNMGNVLKDQGKLDEAIDVYNKTLLLKPDFAEAYYNMGNVLKDQGKLEEAIEAYNKILSLKPDFVQAYYNMGLALQDQGKLEEAIEAYNKTLSKKPDYAEAIYNMGITLQDQGKLKEAIEAYNKTLSIKPDYADAYLNMGGALKYQGKSEEAIEAFNKALSIKPDFALAYYNIGCILQDQGKLKEAIEAYNRTLFLEPNTDEAWINLQIVLQAIKLQIKSYQNINILYPTEINSNYGKIELSILDYILNRGKENEAVHLDRALHNISTAENINIQNPAYNNNPDDQIHSLPDNMVALVHFGRSGTGLMHSLIDGHPEVSTLPSIYFKEYFNHSTWLSITSAGWDGMIDRFFAIYEVLFDASSSVPVEGKSKSFIKNIGIIEGMANVGDQKNEVLQVNKDLFRTELKRLMACYYQLDAFIFFKLVHVAYSKATKDLKSKSLIFYHIHNPDTYAKLNFVRLSPNANWLVMVREPIQSCESWISDSFQKKDYFGVVTRILTMLFEIDNSIYSRQRSIGFRLEDLKIMPRKIMPHLCRWMGIEENDSLYEMTAQGKKWWGDPSSPDFQKDGMDPFGKTSINRKVGSIFSENDQFILGTLFYPFSVRFGYREENEEQFEADLQKIRPMIDEIFDFEKTIAGKMNISCDKLVGSVSYLYLRSGLIERWNKLNEFDTYPNMINPLKIETVSIIKKSSK